MSEALKVEQLTKYYGRRCVLQDVSFTIHKGECFGLLGHNGAGKTTTLECILQLKSYEKGAIQLLGQPWKGKQKARYQKLGVQFQESNYPERMKVKEVCELYASMYTNAQDYKVMLQEFQLASFSSHYINDLSGGERQRLSILLAILPNPDVLFLDELTTGLDAQARRALWKYIQAYQQKGKSILLTSHYMDEVEALCDRITILKEGRQVFIGSVEEAKKASGCEGFEDAYLWFQREETK